MIILISVIMAILVISCKKKAEEMTSAMGSDKYVHYSASDWKSKPGIEFSKASDNSIVILSRKENPQSGAAPDGAYLEIPADIADKFSDQKVRVIFMARKGGEEPSRSIWVSYANSAGDSGWKKFDLSKDLKEYSFEYPVAMTRGKKHYVGFNTDLKACDETAVVDKVEVEIVK